MIVWKKYVGIFAVLSFLMAGFPGISYASIICKQDTNTAEAAMTQDQQKHARCQDMAETHIMQKAAEKQQNCCQHLCDGMGCGKMPVVIPAETTGFKAPVLNGYEVFDLTSNGTRLERLMRPPILR